MKYVSLNSETRKLIRMKNYDAIKSKYHLGDLFVALTVKVLSKEKRQLMLYLADYDRMLKM